MSRRKRLLRLGFGSLAAAIAAGGLAAITAPVQYAGNMFLSVSPMESLMVAIAGLAILTSIISFVMAAVASDQ